MAKVQVKIVSKKPSDFLNFQQLLGSAEKQLEKTFQISHCTRIASALTPPKGETTDCFILYLDENVDGFQEIRRIRLHKDFLFAPVIVIGGPKNKSAIADYIRHGVQSYIPINELDPDTLIDFLDKASNKVRIWDTLKAQKQKKNDQLAIVSHDLKGPLTIIRSYMDILLNDPQFNLNDSAKEKVIRAKYNAQIAYDLVVDILDEFRAKKNWRMQFSKLNLPHILNEIIDNLKVKAEEKNINLKIKIENHNPIFADRRSMLQLFANVIDNAIKFSPENRTVMISVRPHTSTIPSVKQLKDYMNIVVSDKGPGIPADQLKTIFDSYKQVRKSDENTGFGLGLSICKRICQLHMGRIWATPRHQGTSIHILLPAFNASEANADPNPNSLKDTITQDIYRITQQRTILIVDDSKDIREITKKTLIDLGFDIVLAKNGSEALEILKEFTPDLILLDLNMPTMSGDEFLKEIKSKNGSDYPIFIYSILKSEAVFSQSIRQTEGFVQKPLNIEEFVAKTKIHLGWKFFSKSSKNKNQKQISNGKSLSNKINNNKSHLKILLVDDCRDNHEILKYHFYQTDHELDSAYSGADCLKQVLNKDYDIILMDLVMPRMDGFEATKKLHSIVKEKSKSLPLVYAFTVDETDLNAGELLSRGFSGYITKPINLDQLNTIIKQYEDIGSNHGRKRDNTYETEAFL